MTEAEFRQRRRQQFLTQKYFALNVRMLNAAISSGMKGVANARLLKYPDSASEGGIFKDKLKTLRLHYTAGDPVESLRPMLSEVMKWFDEWHDAEKACLALLARNSETPLNLDFSPLPFDDLFHFQLAMDLVSLGILLGDGNAVREAARRLESNRGTDMMFEAVIEPAVSDFRDTEEFFHEKPYGFLVDAIYTAETPQEASAFVKRYLENWYGSFAGVPWHDGHTIVTDEYSNYEGYWAFDAAAICVIHNIDDASFRDHIVYPKDLADWARAHNVLAVVKPGALVDQGSLRCAAGNPCPREGYWLTPAAENSRRYFQNGEIMPDLGGDYGATIWQWDADQSA